MAQYAAVAAVSFATSYLIRKYFPVKASQLTGSSDLSLPSIAEGTRLPMIIGTRRTAGNYIWIGNYKKHKVKEKSGGKGGSNGSSSNNYTVSFAIALCSVNMSAGASILKIWHGDEELTGWAKDENIRIYSGVAGQAPDAYLSSQTGRWSAYEGICYAVFEDFSLGASPSLPILSFEVQAGVLENGGYSTLDSRTAPSAGTPMFSINYSSLNIIYRHTDGVLYYPTVTGEFMFQDYQIPENILNDVTYMTSNNIVYTRRDNPDGSITFTGELSVAGVKYDACSATLNISNPNTDDFVVTASGDVLIPMIGSYGSAYMRIRYNSYNVHKDSEGTLRIICDLDVSTHTVINGIKTEIDSVKVVHNVSGQWVGCWTTESGVECLYERARHFFNFYSDDSKYSGGDFTPLKARMLGGYSPIYTQETVTKGGTSELYLWLYEYGVNCINFRTPTNNLYFTFPLNTIIPTMAYNFNIPQYEGDLIHPNIARVMQKTLTAKSLVSSDYDYSVAKVISTLVSNQKSGVSQKFIANTGERTLEVRFSEFMAYAQTREPEVKVSLLADSAGNFLDVLDELFTYQPGYVCVDYGTYEIKVLPLDDNRSDGLFLHPVLGYIAPPVVYLSDILSGDDISITRKPLDTTKNQIRLNFTNREKKYDRSVSNAENELSQRETGKREAQTNMLHCCNADIAASLADEYLQRNQQAPYELKFDTAIKYIETFVKGAVVTIMDDIAQTSYTVRVINTVLSADYGLSVTAQQVVGWQAAFVPPVSNQQETISLSADSMWVKRTYIFELPPVVTGGKTGFVIALQPYPEDKAYAGAVIYESTDGGNSFTMIDKTENTAIGGSVTAVAMGVITVALETDDTVPSLSDADSMLFGGYGNLVYIPDLKRFMRYGKTVQTGAKTWKLDWLVYDAFDCPSFGSTGDITVGMRLIFLDISGSPYSAEKPATYAGRSYIYKFPSYNLSGNVQDISSCEQYEQVFEADGARPLAPAGIAVNGLGSVDVVSAGDMIITWVSRNRLALNTTYDDSDFVSFMVQLQGATTRIIMTAEKRYVYTRAQWITDGSPSEFTIQITKISSAMQSKTAEKTIKVIA